MKFNRSFLSTTVAAATLVAVTLVPAQAQATSGYVTVYFTRHAEKMTDTVSLGEATTTYEADYDVRDAKGNVIPTPLGASGSKGDKLDEICGESKCAEVLNPLGELRAELLADFLGRWGVTRRLDAVYSSHKARTRQTVEITATAAGLEVVQLPVGGTELEPEGTGPSECPTVEAILSANPGDTLLVAGHSGTLYDIMGTGVKDCSANGLGLNTDNDNRFPKDEDGKVRDYGDLWKVVIRNGNARFVYRMNLQPKYLFIENKAF